MSKIPIIDLFAGPGGLGEGFSSVFDINGERVFDIKLSIEKDDDAHKTLRLRSFYRQFKRENVPELYYSYIKENNLKKKEIIFRQLKKEYPVEWEYAELEAWKFELPYKEGKNGEGEKEGYTQKEIKDRHIEIDKRIIQSLGNNKNWVLIGGPPCQAFSLVGRSRNQGISNDDHRVHLYKEYLRIIANHNPSVFVMENVKGLLSAKIGNKRVFDYIKSDLSNPGSIFKNLDSYKYKIYSLVKEPDMTDRKGFPLYKSDKDFLIKTELHGVPQKRHRVILLGIRSDLIFNKFGSLEQKKEVTLKSVIGSLPIIRSGIGREIAGKKENGKHLYSKINNTQKCWEGAVSYYRKKLAEEFNDPELINEINYPLTQGANYLPYNRSEISNPLNDWYHDPRLKGILNHETRTHLKEDFSRYLFSALYLQKYKDFPKLRDYPEWLLPEHKNAKGIKFTDRFRTQKPNEAATTITSHISKDGHYFIHYDPAQCRSLTVREAARIQTFPDNYYFCGARTAQYHQVGNAVPPYLAKQIGEIVKEIIKKANL